MSFKLTSSSFSCEALKCNGTDKKLKKKYSIVGIFCIIEVENRPYLSMSNLLPNHFECNDAVRDDALERLRALVALGIILEEVRRMGLEYYTNFFNQDAADFYLPKVLEQIWYEIKT